MGKLGRCFGEKYGKSSAESIIFLKTEKVITFGVELWKIRLRIF